MKYKDFGFQDFVNDTYFQQWVTSPNAKRNLFWAQFLEDHPEQNGNISKARRVILEFKNDKLPQNRQALENILENIHKEIDKSSPGFNVINSRKSTSTKRNRNQHWWVAASIVVLIGLGFWGASTAGWIFPADKQLTPPRITLKLQDGSEQVLEEDAIKNITTTTGNTIGSQDKHVLRYHNLEGVNRLEYNEITVPYSRNFELILADGTHVYLNSGTRFRYPVQFLPDKPRAVFLEGQAYFKVAEEKEHPFIVATEQMNTRVYGTEFCVTNYTEDKITYTVLLEGSVGVYQPKDSINTHSIQKIIPGQKATFDTGDISIEDVEVRKYIAWMRGELYFVEDNVDFIFKELQRHYNVEIINTYSALNSKKFTSSFRSQRPINEVLHVLSVIEPFTYTISGNTITISAPSDTPPEQEK